MHHKTLLAMCMYFSCWIFLWMPQFAFLLEGSWNNSFLAACITKHWLNKRVNRRIRGIFTPLSPFFHWNLSLWYRHKHCSWYVRDCKIAYIRRDASMHSNAARITQFFPENNRLVFIKTYRRYYTTGNFLEIQCLIKKNY